MNKRTFSHTQNNVWHNQQENNAYEILAILGFIGGWSGSEDLSSTYKKILASELQKKSTGVVSKI
jgi:hypothetical protein